MTTSPALHERISWLEDAVRHALRRSGAVVQISGGIDSAVALHLTVRALGPQRVFALFMPEDATAPESLAMAQLAARSAGCELHTHAVTGLVEAMVGADEVVRVVRRYAPAFDITRDGYAINVDPETSVRFGTPVFRIHVGPRREQPVMSALLRPVDLRTLMAMQNIKQRLRMAVAYRYAEARGFAVVGATNADELDFGFTVKFGDDAADVYAIVDLSKRDVRQIAEELGVPQPIREREPTTDTFTLKQSQSEYYYLLDAASLRDMDSGINAAYNTAAMQTVIGAYRRTALFNSQRLRFDRTADAI